MSRELNRDLFNSQAGTLSSHSTAKNSARPAVDAPAIATREDIRILTFQVETAQRKIKEFESRMETLASKWDEFSSTAKLRFERIQGHFQRQGEAVQASFRDLHAKVSLIAGKITERKQAEAAIQDMVERHQHIVQTFEVRLQQLQKVMSDQELQLLNSRAELKDALKELSKLKRG